MTDGSPTRARLSRTLRFVLLSLILILGAALRLVRLNDLPPGPFVDEVAIAVNAHLLGTTGRDLNNDKFPLFSKLDRAMGMTGIVSQPIYQYMAIPFVHLFGLNPRGVRMTSVFFGLLGIVAVYLLGRVLAGDTVGLLAALFLAISPWHLQFSGIAFEAISLPAILALGFWSLRRGLSSRKHFYLGIALLGLSTYAYPTAKFFTPLLVAGFAIFYRKEFLLPRKHLLVAAVLLFMLAIPNLQSTFFGSSSGRTKMSGIWIDYLDAERAVRELKRSENSETAKFILTHRPVLVPYLFIYNYAAYLGPRYLYFFGDLQPRHGLGKIGVCYAFYFPLLIAGVIWLWRTRGSSDSRFLLWWLFTYPIPPSLATGAPHAIRSIHAMPMLEIIAAIGLIAIFELIRHLTSVGLHARKRLLIAGTALTLLSAPIQFGWYLHEYYGNYAKASGCWWNAGLGDAIRYVDSKKFEFDRVFITPRVSHAYLYILFFGNIDWPRLDLSGSPSEQLLPFKYILLKDTNTQEMTNRDILMVSDNDLARFATWEVIQSFNCADESSLVHILKPKSAN